MRLPLSYSFRNIARRPWRTGMTAAGVAVVVFAVVLMLALSRGLAGRLEATGEPENLLAISRAGQSHMFSSITPDEVVHLWSLPGVAASADGTPMVSPELTHVPFVVSLDKVEGEDRPQRTPIPVRGVTPVAFEVHRSLRLTGGRLPETSFEILAGSAAHNKLGVPPESLAVGRSVSFENRKWTICGTFEAGGALYESELWAIESDLLTVLRRRTHSFVVVRFEDAGKVAEALKQFERSGAVERYFKGWSEVGYYREFMGALAWITWLSAFMVAAAVIAGVLIGVNTMYSAVMGRLGEIAVQRVLGFGRLDIAVSFLVEAVAISLAGGLAGVAAGAFVDDMPMALSQGAFFLVVDGRVMAAGLGLSVVIGVVGALLPTVKGLRMGIVEAMRYA